MDYQKNQLYFKGVSRKGPIFLIILGAVLSYLFIMMGMLLLTETGNIYSLIAIPFALIGIPLIIVGIRRCRDAGKNGVTDEEFDAEVAKMLKNIQQKAMDKLGIDEDEVKEIDPVYFDGFDYNNVRNVKRGEDGLWRSNKFEAVMLFFSSSEVHCYTYRFDTTENRFTEATDVYFYSDVVSVSTSSETISVCGKSIDYESFKLTTMGGTTLSVSLRNTSGVQRTVNAMRGLLKAKKQER